jgi:hypothetical protein
MSGRRLAGRVVVGSVGVSVVAGLALAVLSTGLVGLAEDSWATPSTPVPVRATDGTTAGSTDTRRLQVHVLAPRSVPIGSSRQLRVQVANDHPGDDSRQERLRIDFRSDDRRISVRPEALILTRAELTWTPFALAARSDLTCEDELDGVLEVTVTPLLDPERAGVRRVAMPEIDCREAPPAAPATVHVTDAVCGENHEAQARRLLDDEHLDPRRCAPDRWRDGELQPWPPPPPPPPPAPTPAPPPMQDEQPDSDPEDDDTDSEPDDTQEGDPGEDDGATTDGETGHDNGAPDGSGNGASSDDDANESEDDGDEGRGETAAQDAEEGDGDDP